MALKDTVLLEVPVPDTEAVLLGDWVPVTVGVKVGLEEGVGVWEVLGVGLVEELTDGVGVAVAAGVEGGVLLGEGVAGGVAVGVCVGLTSAAEEEGLGGGLAVAVLVSEPVEVEVVLATAVEVLEATRLPPMLKP